MRDETRVADFEYETPELIEVGDFRKVTLGYAGHSFDWAWTHHGNPSVAAT